jgi:hemoglobin/transferrin/lactoferrin receptor protein
VRYSYVGSEAAFDTTLFAFPFPTARVQAGAVNGSLGAVFKPFAAWQLYLNGATGYRAPNIDDIGKVFESEPGSVVVPNPALKPEYAYSAEVGTAGLLGKACKMNLSVYYTLLEGALARRNYTFNGQDSIAYDGQLSRVQAIQNCPAPTSGAYRPGWT